MTMYALKNPSGETDWVNLDAIEVATYFAGVPGGNRLHLQFSKMEKIVCSEPDIAAIATALKITIPKPPAPPAAA